MFQPEIIWNYFQVFIQAHDRFSMLMIVSLLLVIPLWWWQPKDQKLAVTPLWLLLLSFCGMALSDVLQAFDVRFYPFAGQVGIIICGAAFIRLLCLYGFKLVLPLFRLHPLPVFKTMVEAAAYFIWLMAYMHHAGMDVSGIILIAVILSAGLAFSLELSMGNIFGGFALQYDNLIKIGDWINVDDTDGRVIDIRWRYTSIETRNWETVFIPNNVLLKSKFSVLGRRDGKPVQWRRFSVFRYRI